MGRQEIMKQRSREIFDTASRILCEMGYEKASIREIAQATGMTKAGLYYYFKSKEDLLFIILDGYMDELLAGMEHIAQKVQDPEQRLKDFIRFQVDMYCRDMHRSKLIIHDENCLTGVMNQTIKDKQRAYLAFWKNALVEYGKLHGKNLEHVSAQVMCLIGMCNWIYQWYDPRGDLKPENLARLIFQRFFHGFEQ